MTQRTRTAEQQGQRAQSTNQVHQDFASVENEDGVSFRNGNMVVDNVAQVPIAVQQWQSSNGLTAYSTVTWDHPHTHDKRVSCNCPGWAIKKRGMPRRCKHTDDAMGIKTCKATKIRPGQQITTIKQAEELIEKFDGKELRGIMLD